MPRVDRPKALRLACALALATAWLAPAPSAAQDIGPTGPCEGATGGCVTSDLEFHHRDAAFDSVSLDTGWVPDGSPLQVRLGFFLGGETRVDMAATGEVSWPTPLTVRVPGKPGTGRLLVDYGLEVVARIRFDVEVAGVRYRWEGDALPASIPADLRLAAEAAFDPFLLPGAPARPVEVSDTTDSIPVLGVDLGGMTGIAGLSGRFSISLGAALRASYQTERIDLVDAASPIARLDAAAIVGPDPGETSFGAAKDVVVAPQGRLAYDGALRVLPGLDIRVAGRSFSLPIGSFDVPIVMADRDVAFDPQTIHVPLPDVVVRPRELDFGAVPLGETATMLLTIENAGDAPLHVRARPLASPFGFGVDALEVPPHGERSVEVSFSPALAGAEDARLRLETDDPDASLVLVHLLGFGLEVDAGLSPDAGVSLDAGPGVATAGACACRAAPGAGGPSSHGVAMTALALALVVVRRRRR